MTTPASTLSAPLTLPCGAVLPNRLVKAAMTELLADNRNRATPAHVVLYSAWAKSGPAMMLTGNVQVDYRNLEHPGNVVIQGKQSAEQLTALESWVAEHPQDFRAHFVLGYVYFFIQDYERSKYELVYTLANEPEHAQALRLLDEIYEREYEAALAEEQEGVAQQ